MHLNLKETVFITCILALIAGGAKAQHINNSNLAALNALAMLPNTAPFKDQSIAIARGYSGSEFTATALGFSRQLDKDLNIKAGIAKSHQDPSIIMGGIGISYSW